MSTEVQSIGKYKVLGVLGKGAMGMVYRAEDTILKRQVALKVITGEEVSDEMKARFVTEARAAAGLDHPNILVVYDLGEQEGQPFIAMELLKGEDLKSLLRRRPQLPLREAIDIIVQVCDGLSFAHDHKIVHRDIKPANIWCCPDGRCKVVDFGVAKTESSGLTKTGMVIGTPDYMSPEQIQGKAVDSRSDIFSVGVVFYEMLTRNKPFHAESITSVIYNIVFKVPPSFSELDLDVPPEIERIVGKAMAKDLNERYQDIREMAADLRRYVSGSTQAMPVKAPAAVETDATKALTSEEVAAATSTRAAASPIGKTMVVGETPTMREKLAAPAEAGVAATAKPRKTALFAGIGVAAIAVIVVAVLLLKPKPEPPPPVAGPKAQGVEIVVTPWANIDRLEKVDGGSRTRIEVAEATTPVRLDLEPGSYVMTVSNPDLKLRDTITFDVNTTGTTKVTRPLRDFKVADALDAALRVKP